MKKFKKMIKSISSDLDNQIYGPDWFKIIFFLVLLMPVIVITTIISFTRENTASDFQNPIFKTFLSIPLEFISGLMGLIGVIVGVLLTELYRKAESKLKLKREHMINVIALISDFKIYIKKNRLFQNNKDKLDSLILEGEDFVYRVNLLNLKTYGIYNELRIRAAMSRLTHSFVEIVDKLTSNSIVNPDILDVSEQWLYNQNHDLMNLMAEGCNINLTTGKGFVFVGFRRVTANDKKQLSFEIDAPLWEPFLGLNFVKKYQGEEEKFAYDVNFDKIKYYRCKDHKFAPHAYFTGYDSSNFNIEVHGCCEIFSKKILNILESPKANISTITYI